MRLTGKRLLGIAVIVYAIYLLIDVFGNPDGLGPVLRDWSSSPPSNEQPSAPASDIPTPTNPLNK